MLRRIEETPQPVEPMPHLIVRMLHRVEPAPFLIDWTLHRVERAPFPIDGMLHLVDRMSHPTDGMRHPPRVIRTRDRAATPVPLILLESLGMDYYPRRELPAPGRVAWSPTG